MKRWIVSIALLWSGFSLANERADSIGLLFHHQLLAFPQEKLYLHTDKPYYISGERIWFRAYLIEAVNHIPTTASRYVYVELFNPLDSMLLRVKVREAEGTYHGYLPIPEDVAEGDYTLRAYTTFMLSQDENYFFTKTIRIGDPQARSVHVDEEFDFITESGRKRVNTTLRFLQINLTGAFEPFVPQSVKMKGFSVAGNMNRISVENDGSARFRFDQPSPKGGGKEVPPFLLMDVETSKLPYRKYIRIPTPDDDFDVTFYPEGGSLMQGSSCKMAFKAMKSDGQAIPISGIIYDNEGVEIRTIETEHGGMGVVLHQPEKGKTYYAVCKNALGQSKRFDLPVAADFGYALSINLLRDKIYVKVVKPAEAVQKDELYLFAHVRGVEQLAMVWDANKTVAVFQKDQFPSGVLHFILFDEGKHPVSERLVFINNPDQAQVSIQHDRGMFASRALVKSTVAVTDSDGEPIAGSFSVAVTSDREVTSDTTSNILTYLLLTSDLRGTIENPTVYFKNDNASAWALDMLMLTQGWRRYNVAELVQGRFSYPTTPIEAGAELAGTVKSLLLRRPVENIDITMLSDKGAFDATKTDKDGRFYLNIGDMPDSTRFIVSAVPKKGSLTNLELLIDQAVFPERSLTAIPSTVGIDRLLFAKYADKAEQQYTSEHGLRMYYLPEIAITAQQKPKIESLYFFSEMITPGNTFSEEDIKKIPGSSIYSLLLRVPGVSVSSSDGYHIDGILIRGISSLNAQPPPILVVDDVIYESFYDIINTISVHDIAQITVLKGPETAAFGSRGMGGAICIFTKRGHSNTTAQEKQYNVYAITPLGYQQPVEFYAPKYDTPAKRNAPVPDLRTTIHWQPVVWLDRSGTASFNFYTADESSSYTIVIEGVADDGRIIRQAITLWEKEFLQ